MIIPSISTKVRMRIRGLEMLVFQKILCAYLMDEPYANYKMQNWIFQSSAKFMHKTKKQIWYIYIYIY